METFKIDNIPVNQELKVTAELNEDTGILLMKTHIMGVITDKIVELQSQAIRDSLISMGWTTPETGGEVKRVIRKMELAGGPLIYWCNKLTEAINQTDPASD